MFCHSFYFKEKDVFLSFCFDFLQEWNVTWKFTLTLSSLRLFSPDILFSSEKQNDPREGTNAIQQRKWTS